MRKIKTGDEVVVITGRSKGVRGRVLRVIDKGARLIVEGVNLVKKHVKPNPNINEQGGIRSQEAPIQVSNVAIWNPIANKGDRVGIKILEDGNKVRYFKSNGELVDITEA